MAQVTKEILSPVFIAENGDSYISLDGKAFLVSENSITEAEITSAPGEFRSLVLALNNFSITNEGLTWYNGISRIKFNRETGNFYVNNSEVLAESLSNHLLASGIVNYANKAKIQLFEFAAKNINNFVHLDFVQKIEEGSVKCYVMKLNESFFIYRMNEANRIYKFMELNANEAFDYVLEQTGFEITEMTQELLEGERAKAAEKLERINLLEEMIAFLKDQRGVIAEADKSIAEIKEADTLINSEIKRLEEEIEAIRNNEEVEAIEEGCGECGNDECICANEAEETTEETTNEDAGKEHTEAEEENEIENIGDNSEEGDVEGEEAGKEVEDMESDAKDVTAPEKHEEGTDEAPEDEGEEGAKEVVENEVTEDTAEEIEDAEAEMSEPEKSEEDQENIEMASESTEEDPAETEGPVDEEETNEEEVVNRQDGYVPGTLKFGTDDFAEGTEIQIDAEAYTTSGKDESITVFVNEKPLKVNKRDVELADGETV